MTECTLNVHKWKLFAEYQPARVWHEPESQLCHLLVVYLWVNYFTIYSFHFFSVIKTGTLIAIWAELLLRVTWLIHI